MWRKLWKEEVFSRNHSNCSHQQANQRHTSREEDDWASKNRSAWTLTTKETQCQASLSPWHEEAPHKHRNTTTNICTTQLSTFTSRKLSWLLEPGCDSSRLHPISFNQHVFIASRTRVWIWNIWKTQPGSFRKDKDAKVQESFLKPH